MNTRSIDNARYTILKPVRGGKPLFVNMADDSAVEAVRHRFGNRDLLISACYYTAPDPSAPAVYPLRFHIVSTDLEQARISTLKACYYINERFSIAPDCLEIVYTGGGNITNDVAIDANGADRNSRKTRYIINRDNNGDGNRHGSGSNYNIGDSYNLNVGSNPITEAGNDSAPPAEMIILIPPIVFSGHPTPLMPALNYHLARQVAEAGSCGIDIDVYQRDFFIPLPNSVRRDSHIIPLTFKELLNLDAIAVARLSKSPRSEDSLILPYHVFEAAEWFAETCAEFEKKQHRQDEFRKLLLQKGWEIVPCIRQLMWADLDTQTTLEACRTVAQLYSFIYAGDDEIYYHILRLANRNAVKGYQKLRAIITFAVENPQFVGCNYPLLKRFCPPGRCFMTELIEECENPLLFELRGEQE